MAKANQPVGITGLGKYLPVRRLSNDDLSRMVETSDEWIHSRTGIRNRRIAAAGEATSDMAVAAARAAMVNAGRVAEDVDLLVVATMTPDQPTPSTATLVQHKLGLRPVPAFDIAAACSGFVYGLETVAALVAAGRYRCALLVGAEKMSSIIDWADRSTCVLFGDGAAAALIEPCTPATRFEVVDSLLRADGRCADWLHVPAGGSALPPSAETVSGGLHAIRMNGREVFKGAIREMENVALELLERNGIGPEHLACVVPHQANVRILEALAERLEITRERMFVNIDETGNTSAASIPLGPNPVTLCQARRSTTATTTNAPSISGRGSSSRKFLRGWGTRSTR